MAGWRYLARRLNGDGTETPLHDAVPLTKVSLDRELSGPGGIDASLEPEQQALKTLDGSPLLVPWSTAIYAEKDGQIWHGGILTNLNDGGPKLSLTCTGFTGYAQDQIFNSEFSGVNVDPLDVLRMLWTHIQSKQYGNIALQVDPLKSPVRMGTVDTPESTADGPFVMGWWETHNIGQVIDDLAKDTPFDYRMVHYWDGDIIRHRLELGYPVLGSRRADLRFVVGENIMMIPEIDYEGDSYADAVMVLGAGEGRKMIRGISSRPTNRLHRAVVAERKDANTVQKALRAAEQELALRQGLPDLGAFTVTSMPHAEIGSYDVGDEVQIQTRAGWHDGLDVWVRIIGITTNPETDQDELTVVRSERA